MDTLYTPYIQTLYTNAQYTNKSYTINIIDTVDSLNINFNKIHNEKIKEIYDIIDIEISIESDSLEITEKNKKLVTYIFSNKKNNNQKNVNYSIKLLQDIKEYINIEQTINKLNIKQESLKREYGNINTSDKISTSDKINTSDKIIIETPTINSCDMRGWKLESKFESKFDLKNLSSVNLDSVNMNVNDYSFCSSSDLNNYESNYKSIKDKSCYLLYINYYNISIVLENDLYDIIDLLDNFKEFTLIESGKIHFKEFLHKRVFSSMLEFKTTYNSLKSSLPQSDDFMMQYNIENYIKNTFEITDKLNDRQKASDFYNSIKKECGFTFDSRQFSQILLKLGLKKKRYGDGIYYYGLKEKSTETNTSTNDIFNESFKIDLFKGLPNEYSLLKETDTNVLISDKISDRKQKIEPLDKILTQTTSSKFNTKCG